MKKIISVIMIAAVLSLAFALFSCADADVSGIEGIVAKSTQTEKQSVISGGNEESGDPSSTLVRGKNIDNTYTSEYLGIKVTLTDGWTLLGDSSLTSMNNSSMALFDMYAMGQNGSSMTIIYEDLEATGEASLSEADYLRNAAPVTKSTLEKLGYSLTLSEVTKTEVAGSEYDSISLTGPLAGTDVNIFEMLICRRIGKYMAVITVSATSQSALDGIISSIEKN